MIDKAATANPLILVSKDSEEEGLAACVDEEEGFAPCVDEEEGFAACVDEEEGFAACVDEEEGITEGVNDEEGVLVYVDEEEGITAGVGVSAGTCVADGSTAFVLLLSTVLEGVLVMEGLGRDDGEEDGMSLWLMRPDPANVTSACATKRPSTSVLLSTEIPVPANTLPTNEDDVPRANDEPTFQYTFAGLAPFLRMKDVDVPVVTVVAVLKINWALESPSPSKVNVEVVKTKLPESEQ